MIDGDGGECIPISIVSEVCSRCSKRVSEDAIVLRWITSTTYNHQKKRSKGKEKEKKKKRRGGEYRIARKLSTFEEIHSKAACVWMRCVACVGPQHSIGVLLEKRGHSSSYCSCLAREEKKTKQNKTKQKKRREKKRRERKVDVSSCFYIPALSMLITKAISLAHGWLSANPTAPNSPVSSAPLNINIWSYQHKEEEEKEKGKEDARRGNRKRRMEKMNREEGDG